MPSIAHLSDVHFGRHDPGAVDAILADLKELQPTLVVISGDFTQRAKRSQFRLAHAFLVEIEALGLPWLAVPGNHDVPLYDVARRFLSPLRRYRRYITPDLAPRFVAPGLAVVGINTARSLTWSDGRVSRDQIEAIAAAFGDADPEAARVLVTHHPLVELPWGEDGASLKAAGRARRALDAASVAGVEMLLAGHHHRSFTGSAATFRAANGAVLVVQAGTATSTRVRGEANSYNLIRTSPGSAEIEVRARTTEAFETVRVERHRLVDGVWAAEPRP
ncbi:metallophosphoesterase family protein [Glacieibacterium sp.]|uniref:metallophosphoesterase family protein n=1 Tax=Glacieibacterium sp. TaxID=2860237 RepID=UPI003AFF79C2